MDLGKRTPRISIGLPVYNREQHVGAAIEAHLCQSCADFELIICDNASTDRTEEICRRHAAQDPRIKYFRNPENLGATGNYRRCFELAVGNYFRWTPSDDLVSPNLLERCVEVLDRDPSVIVAYPSTKLIDEAGRVLADHEENLHLVDPHPSERFKAVLRNFRLGNLIYGLMRSDGLRRTGLLRNYSGGDIPLVAELALYGKFLEVRDAFFYRRMHQEASSAMKSEADVMALYDPRKRDQFFPRTWVHLGAHFRSVWRAPIGLSEKTRISWFLLRWASWDRRALFGELARAVQHARHKVGSA